MLRTVIIFIFAVVLHSSSAQPSHIEGFIYLGLIPSSSNAPSSIKASSYYMSTTPATWNLALTRCSQIEGILATPLNPKEDTALRNYMAETSYGNGGNVWTGGSRNGTVWKWTSKNVNMQWENFHSAACKTGTAANLCLSASFLGPVWGWCATNCAGAQHYVCEF